MKRFVVDWVGNYLFFVPLVTLFNGWEVGGPVWNTYALASIPLAAIGGRGYTLFLKKFWYQIMRESF